VVACFEFMAGESGNEILRFRLTSIDSWNFAKLVELNISQNVINLCHLSSMPPSARFAVEEALTVLHHDTIVITPWTVGTVL